MDRRAKINNNYYLERVFCTALLDFDFLFYTSLSIVHNSFWIVYYPLCICSFFTSILWLESARRLYIIAVWLSHFNRCHLYIHSIVTNRFVLAMNMKPNTIFVRWYSATTINMCWHTMQHSISKCSFNWISWNIRMDNSIEMYWIKNVALTRQCHIWLELSS